VIVNGLHDRPVGDTVTVTDSRGGTYTAGPHVSGTVSPTSAWFFQRYLPSAPGAMTLTAHQSDTGGTLQLAVRVLDGAAASQSGAAAGAWNGATAATTQARAITATAAGSWVFAAAASGNASASLTPASSREVNIDIWHDPAAGDNGAIARQVTASPGSQTLGWVASQADPFTWAAQEVVPAC
jgi:hypothetical protein